jgi:hypothetical protein
MIRPGEYFAPDRSLRPPRPCLDFIPDAKSSVSSQSTLLKSAISGHGFKSLNERQLAAGRTRLAGAQAQTARIENAILTVEHVSLALIKKQRRNIVSERMLSILEKIAAPFEMRSRGEVQEIVRDESYECAEELSEMKAVRGSGRNAVVAGGYDAG